MKSKDYCNYCDHVNCNPEGEPTCWDGIHFNGIELIPIEQVAEILKGLCGFPCIYVKCKNSNFCKEYCTRDYIDTKQCWLYVLREGLLE